MWTIYPVFLPAPDCYYHAPVYIYSIQHFFTGKLTYPLLSWFVQVSEPSHSKPDIKFLRSFFLRFRSSLSAVSLLCSLFNVMIAQCIFQSLIVKYRAYMAGQKQHQLLTQSYVNSACCTRGVYFIASLPPAIKLLKTFNTCVSNLTQSLPCLSYSTCWTGPLSPCCLTVTCWTGHSYPVHQSPSLSPLTEHCVSKTTPRVQWKI